MRTSLLLSTLFAVSAPLVMVSSAALADKLHDGAQPAREPRIVVEQLRAHGDVVDKVYSAPVADREERGAGQVSSQARQARQPSAGRARLDPAASRINCSDTGADCASHGAAPTRAAAGGESLAGQAGGRSVRIPAFLDKILGSDRTNFNEAGLDEGMSTRAANRAWSHAAGSHHGASTGMSALSTPAQVDRKEQQASSARMSCNEGDECSMSMKAARKEWAQASIKAGTWSGPAPEPVSPAAVRIAASLRSEGAAEGATGKGSQAKEGHASGGGGGAPEHQD